MNIPYKQIDDSNCFSKQFYYFSVVVFWADENVNKRERVKIEIAMIVVDENDPVGGAYTLKVCYYYRYISIIVFRFVSLIFSWLTNFRMICKFALIFWVASVHVYVQKVCTQNRKNALSCKKTVKKHLKFKWCL